MKSFVLAFLLFVAGGEPSCKGSMTQFRAEIAAANAQGTDIEIEVLSEKAVRTILEEIGQPEFAFKEVIIAFSIKQNRAVLFLTDGDCIVDFTVPLPFHMIERYLRRGRANA